MSPITTFVGRKKDPVMSQKYSIAFAILDMMDTVETNNEIMIHWQAFQIPELMKCPVGSH